jgi:hypothetical protein
MEGRSINLPTDLPRRALFRSTGIPVLSFSYFMVTPLLALYPPADQHTSPSGIGIILAITNEGCQVFIGVGSDRWGNRPLLRLGASPPALAIPDSRPARPFPSSWRAGSAAARAAAHTTAEAVIGKNSEAA